jgi:hemin uptake protein HemP
MNRIVTIFALLLAYSLGSYASDSAVHVELDASKAAPRSVESLTEQVILRDYRFAWTSIAQALEFNTLDPLEGAFTGESKQALTQSVTSQQRSGLSQRYVDQSHKVQAVFYAPEGDVIELHDTAEYQLQILDSGKLIHEEHVVVHYVVLMTPAADRWTVRHLQAVPQF